jgi:hypothetical protein
MKQPSYCVFFFFHFGIFAKMRELTFFLQKIVSIGAFQIRESNGIKFLASKIHFQFGNELSRCRKKE